MGTSQSHSLKTTPQWSSAKKAMTGVIKDQGNAQKHSKLMTAFGAAISDGLYRGGGYHAGGGGVGFGRTGSRALGNVIQFISDVKSVGIESAIDSLNLAVENRPITPRDLIKALCGLTAEGTEAMMDDEAAIEAQAKMLSKIFEDSETLEDVQTILQEVDEGTIDSWILDFEVEYIIEYMGELFQSHIFEKSANPDAVCNEIKQWLRSELENRLAEEMKHINMFSPEGKDYIDSLTARILEIWQE